MNVKNNNQGFMYSTHSITNVNIDFIYLVGARRLDKPNMVRHSQCQIHLDFVAHRDKLRKNGSFSNYIENINCPSINNLKLTLSMLLFKDLTCCWCWWYVSSGCKCCCRRCQNRFSVSYYLNNSTRSYPKYYIGILGTLQVPSTWVVSVCVAGRYGWKVSKCVRPWRGIFA